MRPQALLDHPWPPEEAFNARSPGFNVILRFIEVQRTYDLTILPIFSEEEVVGMWTRLDARAHKMNGFARFKGALAHLVRRSPVRCIATPTPGPEDLSQCWRASLRDATVAGSWRNPQIVVPSSRERSWPEAEIAIRIEACGDEAEQDAGSRLVRALDGYDRDLLAQSDFNPWNLQRRSEGGDIHISKPRLLPRPPSLTGLPLDEMQLALAAVRRAGWLILGRYYFIPPADWRFAEIEKVAWRAARIFRKVHLEQDKAPGFVDYLRNRWIWDVEERHWDVQLEAGGYKRISHTGDEL